MAKQVINTGGAPNDDTGDTLRTSFTKCNDNFTELYAGQVGLKVGFSAKKSAHQTGNAAGYAKVTFPTEEHDDGGYYDASLSRWTPPPGIVHIDAATQLSALAAYADSFIYIYKNGAPVKSGSVITNASGVSYTQVSADFSVGGADYFEIYVWGGTAGYNVLQSELTYFNGHLTGGPKGDTGATGASGSVTGTLSQPQGRLVCGTSAVQTTSYTSTMIYYYPYVGNKVPIYDGTGWSMMSVATLLACTTTDTTKNPSAIGASKVNDWYVWNDAGTLRLSHGPDWTSDTARSGSPPGYVDGILMNPANITNGPLAGRGTYVGTTRSNASSLFTWQYPGDRVAGFLGVWNCYNRALVTGLYYDANTSWTYATVAWRPIANNLNAYIAAVFGLQEDAIEVTHNSTAWSTGSGFTVGVGLNSYGPPTGTSLHGMNGPTGQYHNQMASYSGTVLGFNSWWASESCQAAATVTFMGASTLFKPGMTFTAWM